jgi:hypothetical protein
LIQATFGYPQRRLYGLGQGKLITLDLNLTRSIACTIQLGADVFGPPGLLFFERKELGKTWLRLGPAQEEPCNESRNYDK